MAKAEEIVSAKGLTDTVRMHGKMFQVGDQFDRYQVRSYLAQGGMADLYRAFDLMTNQEVVLKIPNRMMMGDPTQYERFQREMEATQTLHHPAIQQGLGAGQFNRIPYLVTAFVDGQSMRDLVTEKAPLSSEQAVALIRKVADGMAYCHENNVIHRDLKPENILVTHEGQPVIVDFGLALTKDARRVTYANLTPSAGTPDYMSPEQIEGQRGDQRTDVYAVGTMLYELLTGHLPFTGDNYQVVISQHLRGAIPRLDHEKPDISPQLAAVVARTLQRSLDDRYPTMRDFIHDLDHLNEVNTSILDTGTGAQTALPFWRSSTFQTVIITLLVMVGIVIFFCCCPRIRPEMTTPEDILSEVKQKDIRFIDLQFTDILGVVKSTTIPITQLNSALDHGIWFDGSSVEGFARIAESDMYLKPDLSTFALVPWRTGRDATARFICDVYMPNNQPFPGDPRAILKRSLAEAEKMGFSFNTGPELEFFLLKPHADGSIIPPIPSDSDSYFDIPTDLIGGLRYEVTRALEVLGIMVEAMHAEVAHGQHEIDFRYSDALTTANNAVTFRVALKVIARQNQLYATFLPKPIRGMSGNGMHVHQSLVYKTTGVNAFSDPGDQYGLSQTAKHFIAGQLAHARGMCAILSPLVNSYKRLVPGYEAPVYISWGRINRSALIRVPRAHTPDSTRVEFRSPDPSCNPYLAFAVMLAAGLDGIRRELPLVAPNEENLYLVENHRKEPPLHLLPGSLEDALDSMEADPLIREVLGVQTFERFLQGKRQEWADYRLEISTWELEKYLNSY